MRQDGTIYEIPEGQLPEKVTDLMLSMEQCKQILNLSPEERQKYFIEEKFKTFISTLDVKPDTMKLIAMKRGFFAGWEAKSQADK